MQRILDRLRAAAHAAPHDTLLTQTLRLLQEHHPPRDLLRRNLELLRDRGLWDHNDDLDALLGSANEGISIAAPPHQSQLVARQDPLLLPVELVEVLNKAYFLHVLAADPAQVLPPGKSLLSVMSRTHTAADGDTKLTLHSKVEDLVHKAFWDEAVATLFNPEPSVQLPRIRLLYADLSVALSPLLPPNHPVLVTLSSPLSPTSSPLDSALMHLREILMSLRERCAPVRDPDIEALQQQLNDPPSATLVAEIVRSILKLSEIMKDDLSQFVLGTMTEHQLKSVVTKQAQTTEREIVIDIWRRDRITQGWATWLEMSRGPAHLSSISASPRFLWIVRIVQALGSSLPVSCPIPSRTIQISPTTPSGHETTEPSTPNPNMLPPVFFFSAPSLLKIQNYLQALVIAASLRILARLPPPTRASTDFDSFMSRVWTLLRAEIAGEPDTSDTKLLNLADEVVRARTQATASGPLSKADDATLRAAVDRTLRPEDPVFKLLQRRLLTELLDVLVRRRQEEAASGVGPETLRTGKDGERAGKRPRLVLDPEDVDEPRAPARGPIRMTVDVKGFEDPVLSQALVEVFQQVDNCLGWVERVWGDVVEAGNVRDGGVPRKSDP